MAFAFFIVLELIIRCWTAQCAQIDLYHCFVSEFPLAQPIFSSPKENKMKKVLIFLVAGIFLANACASLATPKITITFSADKKCTMEGTSTIPAGENIPVEVIGYLEGYGTIGIGLARIDPDKTLKDLQDWDMEVQPPWVERIGFYEFPSDGSTYSFDLNMVKGPIYFLCMLESPFAKIGVLGPVEVKE